MQRLYLFGLVRCLIVSLAPLAAQTTTGSIVGTVTDPGGAPIGAAAVTLTSLDTGIATRTITDSTGNYVGTPLRIGRYSVGWRPRASRSRCAPTSQLTSRTAFAWM